MMKTCPFCAEEIQDAAIVCKHCKRELSTQQSNDLFTCPFCKALVGRQSKVCPACGDNISGVTGAPAGGGARASDQSRAAMRVYRNRGLALLAVAIGFILTIASSFTAGVGILLIWIGLAFALTGGAVIRWGGGFILALILGSVGQTIGGTSRSPAPSTPATSSSSQPTYDLALISSKGYESESGGYHYVEGLVTNLSNQPLKNVTAMGIWLDKDGEFIKSDHALIDYNPILPGQTSPFKTISTGNPAMAKFRVEFKTLMGGTLDVDDQRKQR
jgi:hypothetical protein